MVRPRRWASATASRSRGLTGRGQCRAARLVTGVIGAGLLLVVSAPLVATTPSSGTVVGHRVRLRSRCVGSLDLSNWSASALAAQLLVVPVDQGATLLAAAEVREGVGGLLLTGDVPVDLSHDLAVLRTDAPHSVAPFVMTDEEGGSVQRLLDSVGEVPSARTMGATKTPAAIGALAYGLGKKMAALGVTMDLAPSLDADGGPGPNARDAIGTRSFSADVAVASADGIAFAKGLLRAGVVPVVKHFPGLGGASDNTDLAVADTLPWTTLRRGGLSAFANAVDAGLPAVMVSVAVVPGLTTSPAALSPAAVTGVLRTELGFTGLIVSDSLTTPAVTGAGYSLSAAVVAALAAGVDLVLFDSTAAELATTTTTLIRAVVAALTAGELRRSQLVSAVQHVLTAKGLTGCL